MYLQYQSIEIKIKKFIPAENALQISRGTRKEDDVSGKWCTQRSEKQDEKVKRRESKVQKEESRTQCIIIESWKQNERQRVQ